MKSFKKKRNLFNMNPFLLLGIPLIIGLLTISIGFSALSTTLTINGSASFIPVGMIRVTSINQDSLINTTENSKSFSTDNISVSLTNEDSSSVAIYNVNITNLGQTKKVLSRIFSEIFTNDEMDYELTDIRLGQVIAPKESANFQIKFKYKIDEVASDLKLNAKIRFIFEDYKEEVYTAYFKAYNGEFGLFDFDKSQIKEFKRNTTLTIDEVLKKDKVALISNKSDDQYNSKRDIYGWVENGIFYWWSDALIAYFHPDTTKAFYKFSNLVSVDLSGISTEKVYNFAHFFDTSKNLKRIIGQIDTSGLKLVYNPNFDYANDTNNDSSSGYGLTYMFNDCNSLEEVDLSGIVTTNASDMKRMFGGCKKLTNIDVSGFDTSNVRSMYWMFRKNEQLKEIDLSSFDTSNVENMFGMFVDSGNITTIKFGDNFDTSKVKNMGNMFYGLKKLTTIYAKVDFVRNNDVKSANMFLNTVSLVGSKDTNYAFKYNSNYKDKTYAQIATETQKGYFTSYGDSIKYTIAYELDGGATSNPFFYTFGSTIVLEDAVKPGYTFIGWTGSNGNDIQKNVVISSETSGNLVYKANYVPNKYVVKFEANGGIGQMADQEFTYDETKNLSKNLFVRDSYLFTGWNTKDDGAGMFISNEQSITNLVKIDSITLYAQWELSSDALKTFFVLTGPCTLNGETGGITGENCNADPAINYINSKVSLFSEENYQKDFQLEFNLSNYNSSEQDSTQATILNSLLEKNGNPGFVIRRYNTKIHILARNHLGVTNSMILDITDNTSFKIVRKNGNLCYSINNSEFKYLNNYQGFNKPFDLPVYFGASADSNGDVFRNIRGTISNASIKIGILDDSVKCNS